MTRAVKRAREADRDRNGDGGVEDRDGARRRVSIESPTCNYHIDSNPPPSYHPTHPPPPHLLSTTSPVIPALVTAEAVAWSSDPGVAGARELSREGGDGGHPSPMPQAGVVCCPAANPCPAPPPTVLPPSMPMAPGAGCREAHCTGLLPHASPMSTAQEGVHREAGPLAQLPPLLKRTSTYPADGGGRRLRTTTTSTRTSPREGQHSTAATAGAVAADVTM